MLLSMALFATSTSCLSSIVLHLSSMRDHASVTFARDVDFAVCTIGRSFRGLDWTLSSRASLLRKPVPRVALRYYRRPTCPT
ncbi:hypothetical protein C8Q73DRAFT_45033 [Cubamyces lactineus]|nr:hypothetical protein C8Q73DRAFT_45033 [Cubamyces lactineus]